MALKYALRRRRLNTTTQQLNAVRKVFWTQGPVLQHHTIDAYAPRSLRRCEFKRKGHDMAYLIRWCMAMAKEAHERQRSIKNAPPSQN